MFYKFQQEGIDFMVDACRKYGGVLNACEVGLGKTIMALGTVSALDLRRVLVLAPKSVLFQWRDEVKEWTGREAVVYAGTPAQRKVLSACLARRELIILMSYETFRIDHKKMPTGWDLVLCDEAHRIGNFKSKLYKALRTMTAEYRIALSATPIMNRLPELYGILHWATPYRLGRFMEFLGRYCNINYWGAVTGAKNIPELKMRIAPMLFRRTVEEVEIELPAVTYQTVPVALSTRERKLYDQIRKELLFEITHTDLSKLSSPMILQNSLTKMGKLLEACDSLELLGDSTESSKLDVLKEHLEDLLID